MTEPFHLRGVDDDDRVGRVRAALHRAEFTEARVARDLGPASQARVGSDLVAHGRLRQASDAAAPLIRLFQQHEAVPRATLKPVIEVDDLTALGLVVIDEATDAVLATVNLAPVRDLFLASDWPSTLPPIRPGAASSHDGSDAPDHVMGVGASTTSLLGLMIPPPSAGTVLDLGTGSGALALAAAQPGIDVTATDLNPRALEFAEWNAEFNQRSIETREGSLFDPVAEEQFDRIVCNPPYVVSPDHEFLYRDAGGEAGGICRRILREAPKRLRPNGLAQVLCNWPIHAEEDPTATPREWVRDLEAAAVLLAAPATPVEVYAAQWMDTMAHPTPQARLDRYYRWLDHYRAAGITSIGHGLVSLERRDGPNFFEVRSTGAGFGADAAEDLRSIFDHQRFLLDSDDAELLATRFALAPGMERRDRAPLNDRRRSTTTLVRRTGILQSAEVDPTLADVLLALDGHVLGEIAATVAHAAGGTRGLLETVRESVRRGWLRRA